MSNATIRRSVVGSVVIVALIPLVGCATVGKRFEYQNRAQLVVGKTTSTETRGILGEPYESATVSNRDGTFLEWAYGHAEVSLTGGSVRILKVEFRNEILNAYGYMSNFQEEEEGNFDYSAAANIKVGVSSKEDALRLLGEPGTVGNCPTVLAQLEQACEEGMQFWNWEYLTRREGASATSLSGKRVAIEFDEEGTILGVRRGLARGPGEKFNYQDRAQLVLNKTTSSEAENILGVPHLSETISNRDGEFQIFRYSHTAPSMSGAVTRELSLEFRDAALNAYHYQSSSKEENAGFNHSAGADIRIGESSRDDVLEILDHPSGMGNCPTTLAYLGGNCEAGAEFSSWAFLAIEKSKLRKSIDVVVVFDGKGTVIDVGKRTEVGTRE